MPKDWIGHKAELKRLYITEGKSLSEIKVILESRGFKASIRSYRTRLHDWGFLKSHSTKPCRTAKATVQASGHGDGFRTSSIESDVIPTTVGLSSQSGIRSMNSSQSSTPRAQAEPPSDLPSSSPKDLDWISLCEYTIPARPIDPKELGSFVPIYDYRYLYFLLVKWQPGGTYMEALRALLQRKNICKLIFKPVDDVLIEYEYKVDKIVEMPVYHLFILIDHYVSPVDQYEVMKLLLSLAGVACDSDIPWVENWSVAKTCHNWEEAEELLEETSIENEMNTLFLQAGRVVLAENLLKHFQQSYNGEGICERCMNYEPWQFRRRCMQILESFYKFESAEFDVDRKFYQQSFRMVEGPEENVFARLEKACELELQKLVEENKKYRKAVSHLSGIVPEEVDGQLQDLLDLTQDGLSALHRKELEKATKTKPDSLDINTATCHTQTPPSVATPGFQQAAPDLTETQMNNFRVLLTTWDSLVQNHSRDDMGSIVGILEGFKDGEFTDLILWTSAHVDPSERAPFVAFLVLAYFGLTALCSFNVHTFARVSGAPKWAGLKQYVLGNFSREEYISRYPLQQALLDHALLHFGQACLTIFKNALDSGLNWNVVADRRVEARLALKDLDEWGLETDPTLRAFTHLFNTYN